MMTKMKAMATFLIVMAVGGCAISVWMPSEPRRDIQVVQTLFELERLGFEVNSVEFLNGKYQFDMQPAGMCVPVPIPGTAPHFNYPSPDINLRQRLHYFAFYASVGAVVGTPLAPSFTLGLVEKCHPARP